MTMKMTLIVNDDDFDIHDDSSLLYSERWTFLVVLPLIHCCTYAEISVLTTKRAMMVMIMISMISFGRVVNH